MSKKTWTPFAAILLILIMALTVFQYTDIFLDIFQIEYVFDVFTAMTLIIELVLCVILFAKKRNIVLIATLTCMTFLSLVQCIVYFSIWTLLYFVVDALLAVLALSVCEQNIIKIDFSKFKNITDKLFYIPAIIYLAITIYWTVYDIIEGEIYFYCLDHIINLIYTIALFNIAAWLKDPYTKETHNTVSIETETEEAYCGLGKHILLLLFTFGIWNLIWTYRTTKYLNKAPNAQYYNPTSKLLLCIFIPFYSIYWYYRHGQRIDAFSKSKGLNGSDMATLCLILGIFIPIVACILMQDKINTLCTVKLENKEKQKENQHIEELKKFKELLDAGIITQEEFDAKKKQLLGL